MRTSTSPGSRETRNQKELSITTEYADVIDGPSHECEIIETEIIQTAATKKNNAFVVDFNEPESSESKESAANREDLLVGKRSSEVSFSLFFPNSLKNAWQIVFDSNNLRKFELQSLKSTKSNELYRVSFFYCTSYREARSTSISGLLREEQCDE